MSECNNQYRHGKPFYVKIHSGHKVPVFGVIGWKNSGKTTLMEQLISSCAKRGLNVCTVKHSHHPVGIDHPGKDSFRHRESGAKQVVLVSPFLFAHVKELSLENEPTFLEVLESVSRCDLILVEGYKDEVFPKIEVWRRIAAGTRPMLATTCPAVVAVAVSNDEREEVIQVFDQQDRNQQDQGAQNSHLISNLMEKRPEIVDLNDTTAITDFLFRYCALG